MNSYRTKLKKSALFLLLFLMMVVSHQSFANKQNRFYKIDGKYVGLVLNENGSFTTIKNDLLNGEFHFYNDKGQLEFSQFFSKGVKEGKIVFYFEDGKIKEEGFYKNNKKDGSWIRWDEQGNKIGIANYSAGKKDGQWKVLSSNGTVLYEMAYANGLKTGTWKVYNEDGQLESEKVF